MTPSGEALRRVRRIGGAMMVATALLAAALIVGYAMVWLAPGALEAVIERRILPDGAPYQLTPFTRSIGFAIGLAPAGLALWGLANAFLLFRGYRAGQVFTEAAGRRLRRSGTALFLLPIAHTLAAGAASVVLTLGNPPGEQHLVIPVSLDSLILCVAGGLLVMVGWAIVEATRIANEHSQFV